MNLYFFNAIQIQDQMNKGLGFGGMNPCAQTHGSKKFYTSGNNTPLSTLLSGNYTKIPIMGGATKNEGTLGCIKCIMNTA